MKTKIVVLAAGKGTRMKSDTPKVLHSILGVEMVHHVLRAVAPLSEDRPVVVVGHGGEQVEAALEGAAQTVWQHEQRGTGHALMVARDAIEDSDRVLVVCGDTPLIRTETMRALVATHEREQYSATVLGVAMDDPSGYGRLLRDQAGRLQSIVEERDATDGQRAITEINSGMYVFETERMLALLDTLKPKNAQGEYYLTDLIGALYAQDQRTGVWLAEDASEIAGINDRVQLAQAATVMRRRINRHWMKEGVTMVDPSCVHIGPDVMLSRDVELWPDVILEGDTRIGAHTVVGAGCRLANAHIGAHCRLEHSIVLDSAMGDGCTIGPFAYIRPGSHLDDGVKIGDFVEIKKTRVGTGSKLPHHSYVGDAVVGAGVNIGAGTITCNYDGHNKHQTHIADGVFVGSNSNLVAPVNIGENAYVAAGSTVTEDVPGDALAIARGRQKNLPGWRSKKGY